MVSNSDDVVITGIGVVTPIGLGIDQFWRGLLEGRVGTGEVTSFDTGRFRVHRGGEIRDFDPSEHVHVQNPQQMGRTSQLAIAAARLALQDADLLPDNFSREQVGVVMGTTSGEPRIIEQFDDELLDEDSHSGNGNFARCYPCHVLAGHIAKEWGFEGVNLVIPAACAAGNYAIAHAMDVLRDGRAQVMLAGGADAFSRITYTGFARLGAIAPDFCRPFDLNRKGMIPGEGAAVLVLESLGSAKRRNAPIYATVAGYGLSCDAYHMTGPHPEGRGAAQAMRQALNHAQVEQDKIGYISAHGTGTKASDRIETGALKKVFGQGAYDIPISSIKSMLGHTMGAASALEAAACAMVVSRNCVPPTANWQTRDPECDLDYVTSGARETTVEAALNNAYAFGGNNASLVVAKCRR